MIFVIMI